MLLSVVDYWQTTAAWKLKRNSIEEGKKKDS